MATDQEIMDAFAKNAAEILRLEARIAAREAENARLREVIRKRRHLDGLLRPSADEIHRLNVEIDAALAPAPAPEGEALG